MFANINQVPQFKHTYLSSNLHASALPTTAAGDLLPLMLPTHLMSSAESMEARPCAPTTTTLQGTYMHKSQVRLGLHRHIHGRKPTPERAQMQGCSVISSSARSGN